MLLYTVPAAGATRATGASAAARAVFSHTEI